MAPNAIDIVKIKDSLIELPAAKRQRFVEEFELSLENAKILVDDKNLASFFEKTISELRSWLIALQESQGT